MRRALIATLMVFMAAPVYANSDKCEAIFTCKLKSKAVEVCDTHNGNLIYRYGKSLDKPEMKVILPYEKASMSHWNGVGRYQNTILNIPNKNTTYSIFNSFDSISQHTQSGVWVEVNGEQVSELICDSDSVHHKLNDIDYLPAAD
ncbi:MAG: hypothetical protein Q4P13_12935 [Psychrobacter sp.]|nr:hypothetical protein [Psychrobacter sp.]